MAGSTSIDLHGLYAEEAELKLSDTIEECRRNGILELTIIHGKGEGILRSVSMKVASRYRKYISDIKKGEEIGALGGEGQLFVSFRFPEIKKMQYISKNVVAKVKKETKIDYEGIANKKKTGRAKYLKRMGNIKNKSPLDRGGNKVDGVCSK